MIDWDPLRLVALLIAGTLAGFVNTMAGGGSMLSLPALMLLGLPADLANGTNRLSIVTQSVSGVVGFARAGKLDSGAIVPTLLPTITGSAVGAVVATQLPREWLKPALLGTMLALAVVMVLKPSAVSAPEDSASLPVGSPRGVVALFAAGLYAGFVQAGVGFILLAVLGGLLRYDLVRANALKLVCTFTFGVVGFAVFIAAGDVVWVPALILSVATVTGSQLGVRFALNVRQSVIRWVIFVGVLATCVAAFLKE